jgi:hypothetical protein
MSHPHSFLDSSIYDQARLLINKINTDQNVSEENAARWNAEFEKWLNTLSADEQVRSRNKIQEIANTPAVQEWIAARIPPTFPEVRKTVHNINFLRVLVARFDEARREMKAPPPGGGSMYAVGGGPWGKMLGKLSSGSGCCEDTDDTEELPPLVPALPAGHPQLSPFNVQNPPTRGVFDVLHHVSGISSGRQTPTLDLLSFSSSYTGDKVAYEAQTGGNRAYAVQTTQY